MPASFADRALTATEDPRSNVLVVETRLPDLLTDHAVRLLTMRPVKLCGRWRSPHC
jgi:hypothetical protein